MGFLIDLEQFLERCLKLKSSIRHFVDKVGGSKNYFALKMFGNIHGQHNGSSNFQKAPVFSLKYSILLRSINT